MQKLYSHAKLSWKNGQKCPGNPENVLEFQLGKRVATLPVYGLWHYYLHIKEKADPKMES